MDDFVSDNLLAEEGDQKHPLALFFKELFKVLIIGAFAVVAIRYFIFKPFVVSGTSMVPTYLDKEYLIIDELSFHLGQPHRGQVIVMHYHGDVDKEYFLKRIIGLPGEHLIIRGGRIRIFNSQHPDGEYLDESAYLGPTVLTDGDIDVTLSSDEYYVMGDNRGASFDSRRFGPVKRVDLVGRALFRGFPLDRISYLAGDVYNHTEP